MQKEVLQKVRDVPEQRHIIRTTTSLAAYQNLVSQYFVGSRWQDQFRNETAKLNTHALNENFYRLSALNAMQVAQFGFALIGGQTLRHEAKGWKKSPVDPKHQLANTIYMARLNTQAQDVKLQYSKQVDNPELSFGVWGTDLQVKKGQIQPTFFILDSLVYQANWRINHDPRPIVLPDPEINAGLAAIDFNGDDADTYTDEQFEETILPQVEPIVYELFDARTVFTTPKK